MMGGGHNSMTQQMDVYAFAICCVEILDMGGMPWKHHDDSAVVRFVYGVFVSYIRVHPANK